MKYKVKLGTVANAVIFSAKCNEYTEDIDYLYDDRYILDAKSVVGVINAGLDRVCIVHIHTDNKHVTEKFRGDIMLWVAE